jgi:hypothetical protein
LGSSEQRGGILGEKQNVVFSFFTRDSAVCLYFTSGVYFGWFDCLSHYAGGSK